MKNKKKLLKKIIIIVLVVAIIVVGAVFLFNSGDDAEDIKLEEIPIITYFGITNASTTEADIINVERDLNNILITDGYAVKLFLAPEDRYDTMVSSAMKMMDEYIKNSKKTAKNRLGFEYKFDYATSTFTWNCSAEAVTPTVVYNQDTIIEMLDAGQEIYPNNPSIDVLLVTDYADYFTLAGDGALERLNGGLSDVAKSLNQSIPAAFFDAVKLNNSGDIFGVPSVQLVGEYEFMVYDQDLLDKYNVSKSQLLSVGDLGSYLETVAADKETNAIPLLNAPVSTVGDFELFNDKSLGVALDGVVTLPYEITNVTKAFYSTYVTISRYRSLGLMGESGANIEDSDFAVAFFSGTEAEVKALSEKTGKNLSYNVYSKPLATSAEVGEAIFCVCSNQKYSSNKPEWGIDFVTLLNKPQSQTDIKNILLYGALGINYNISDEDGKVVIANDNTYSMNNLYTGHTLHALPYDGYAITEEWKEDVRKHNFDLTASKFSGFKFQPTVYSMTDKNGETVRLTGPDYLAVISKICTEIYDDYINGVIGQIDIADFNSRVDGLITDQIKNDVLDEYKKQYEEEQKELYIARINADTAWIESQNETAKANTEKAIKERVESKLKEEYTDRYKNQGYTDATEIEEKLAKDITEDEIKKRIEKDYDEAATAEVFAEQMAKLVSDKANSEFDTYRESAAYANVMKAYQSSAKFSAIVKERFDDTRDEQYYVKLDEEIQDKLLNFSFDLTERIDQALVAANDEFISTNQANFSDTAIEELKSKLLGNYQDIFKNLIAEQYYALKGKPTSVS